MAAYAYTATLDTPVAKRIENHGFRFLTGKLNITNYNATTKVDVTEITGAFKDLQTVIFGTSDVGFGFQIDISNGEVTAWKATAAGGTVEAATDDDAGEAHFIAFGI